MPPKVPGPEDDGSVGALGAARGVTVVHPVPDVHTHRGHVCPPRCLRVHVLVAHALRPVLRKNKLNIKKSSSNNTGNLLLITHR